MISTLTLAFIGAKYKKEFQGLYVTAVIFDICLITITAGIVQTLLGKVG